MYNNAVTPPPTFAEAQAHSPTRAAAVEAPNENFSCIVLHQNSSEVLGLKVISVNFRGSKSAQEANYLRRIICKSTKLTKSERDVLLVIVNLWLHHRYGPEGVIRPGRKFIAKRADVCLNTVKRSLSRFRDMGIIWAVQYAQGGTKATRYKVDLLALEDALDPHGIKTLPGKLIEWRRESGPNEPVSDAHNEPVQGAQNEPRSMETLHTNKEPSQDGDIQGGAL